MLESPSVMRVVVPASFLVLLGGITTLVCADEAAAFFDDTYVHEVYNEFAALNPDVSLGRTTDGSDVLEYLDTPTLGCTNAGSSLQEFSISVIEDGNRVDASDLPDWLKTASVPWVWSARIKTWNNVDESSGSHNSI